MQHVEAMGFIVGASLLVWVSFGKKKPHLVFHSQGVEVKSCRNSVGLDVNKSAMGLSKTCGPQRASPNLQVLPPLCEEIL